MSTIARSAIVTELVLRHGRIQARLACVRTLSGWRKELLACTEDLHLDIGPLARTLLAQAPGARRYRPCREMLFAPAAQPRRGVGVIGAVVEHSLQH